MALSSDSLVSAKPQVSPTFFWVIFIVGTLTETIVLTFTATSTVGGVLVAVDSKVAGPRLR